MPQRSRKGRFIAAIIFVGTAFLASELAGLGRRTLTISTEDGKIFRVELIKSEKLVRMIEFVDGVASHQIELARGKYEVRLRLADKGLLQTVVDMNEDSHLRIDNSEVEFRDLD